MMKDRIKQFWLRFKIFIWYLATEPFREIYGFLYYLSEMLNKTKTWIFVFLVIIIIALIIGKKPVASLLVIVLLFTTLLWEWNSGYFMSRYREKQKQRIKKTLMEKETRIMKEDNGGN